MFNSILTQLQNGLTFQAAALCIFISLAMGFIIALVYMLQGGYTKNFVITLTLLPALVAIVILMVNGNLGTGVAVLGAFGLVRFRSVPGSSREISAIFFAMAVGLAGGMGYLSFSVAITVTICLLLLLLDKSGFGSRELAEKRLKITIAENLDYTEIFDDIFANYTRKHTLEHVKTTNLGSMYELEYHIILKDMKKEKEMIDALRCRNGNLTIVCGRGAGNLEL